VLELAERPSFGHSQQLERRAQGARLDLGLGRDQRPAGPLNRIGRQRRRSLQEGSRRGKSASGLCPAGRPDQLDGDVFVRAERGVRLVPSAAVGVDGRIGCLRQGLMYIVSLLRGCGAIDRRPNQRVAEAHSGAEYRQVGVDGRLRGCRIDPQPGCGSPHQQRIAERFGRDDEQQAAGVARQSPDPSLEALLNAARQGKRAGQAETACELPCRKHPR
jgi:hypothetical protein